MSLPKCQGCGVEGVGAHEVDCPVLAAIIAASVPMSRRDWFAFAALQGRISNYHSVPGLGFKVLAEEAYGIADAMLEESARGNR